jgi:hypothetical protein
LRAGANDRDDFHRRDRSAGMRADSETVGTPTRRRVRELDD